jgi:hypothetical protein
MLIPAASSARLQSLYRCPVLAKRNGSNPDGAFAMQGQAMFVERSAFLPKPYTRLPQHKKKRGSVLPSPSLKRERTPASVVKGWRTVQPSPVGQKIKDPGCCRKQPGSPTRAAMGAMGGHWGLPPYLPIQFPTTPKVPPPDPAAMPPRQEGGIAPGFVEVGEAGICR